VNVEAEDIAEQIVDILPGLGRVATTAAVAERRVEVAVGTELDTQPPL